MNIAIIASDEVQEFSFCRRWLHRRFAQQEFRSSKVNNLNKRTSLVWSIL